jgi:Zn-dependent peptidase ImmA (M78 family)
VKIQRATSGPYRDRLHYTVEEIEHLTEDELRNHDLLPSTPSPINIDLYVEQRFVTPRYDDLKPTLLGYTDFGPNGPVDIVINTSLASDTSTVAKRRVRTTIAHEGGHALLHTILHIDTGQTTLLVTEQEAPRIMCKEEDLKRTAYDGKWWEYQANLAMSSLLLPKQLTLTALEPYLTITKLGVRTLDERNVERAAHALSDVFDVNPVVAKIRIQQLL